MNAQKVVTVFADIPLPEQQHRINRLLNCTPNWIIYLMTECTSKTLFRIILQMTGTFSRLFSEATITLNKTKKAAKYFSLPFLR